LSCFLKGSESWLALYKLDLSPDKTSERKMS